MIMGRRIPGGVLAAVLVFGSVPMVGQTASPEIQRVLMQEVTRLVPDRRLAVCDVHVSEVRGRMVVLHGETQDAGMKRQLVAFLEGQGWRVDADSVRTLPSQVVAETPHGVVAVSVVNIRTKPANAAEMATQAILGTSLRIFDEHDGWYLVQTPDRYLGWTEGRVVLMSDSQFVSWHSRPKIIVTSTYAFAYAHADSDAPIVSDLVAGSILSLVDEGPLAFAVEYPDGRDAFVRKSEARLLDPWLERAGVTGAGLVATAERFMGIPYLWGGTSTKGLDCSGFTKTVYFLNGIQLPRDASQQATVGIPVDGGDSLDQFQSGDLLFFGQRAQGGKKERVTHVAMSLGGTRYIHSSGDVHINSLGPADRDFNEYRRQMFLYARRILGAGEQQGVKRLAEMYEYKR
jgi:hypothetical protein